MPICVAGPYSAPSEEQRAAGADREMDLLAALGRPVFDNLDAVPPA